MANRLDDDRPIGLIITPMPKFEFQERIEIIVKWFMKTFWS